MIRTERLAYRYPQDNGYPRDSRGLNPLSLTIRTGEVVHISGPSGSGKSTLARCLTGIIPHLYRGTMTGDVWLDGMKTSQVPRLCPRRDPLPHTRSRPGTLRMAPENTGVETIRKYATARLPLQLPGHSGIFWMAIMIVAAGVVCKPGAISVVGLTSGIIAAFLGMGDFGALNTLLSYTMVGVGTDLALLLLRNPENLAVAALIGSLGHLSKLMVKWGFGVITGAPVGFIVLDLVWAMVGYIVFGAIGGILGTLTLQALRRAGFFSYLAEKR